MKNIIKISTIFLLALLVFLPLQTAFAGDGSIPGQFIFGQSFTLDNGQTMDGDLVVFGGSATIQEGAVVNGSVVVFGGSLTIAGEVKQDAVVFGGTATLTDTAHVYGDLSTLGSTLNRTNGSLVDGQVNTSDFHFGNGQNGIPVSPKPFLPVLPSPNINFHPLAELANVFTQAFGIAILAMLIMFFLAPHADRVAHAIIDMPLTAGGLGLLTVVAIPLVYLALALLSVLVITLIVTIPLMIAVAVVLGMAALFGWIAVGYEIGQRFTKIIHQEWHPAFSAGLGVFFLTLVANGASLLNFVPGLACITWILPTLIGILALGGVVMTRFGTQAVTPPSKAVVAVTPSDPAPLA
jgi:hypothetical protein